MRERYIQELEQLNLNLYKMCAKVINQIDCSIDALNTGNESLAMKIIDDDNVVDELEKTLENQCLQILLREQPVAKDFRRVSAVLKMITDIERIGDHAQDIAELVLSLHDKRAKDIKYISEMCDLAKEMLAKSVHGYIKEEFSLSESVPPLDVKMDKLFADTKKELAIYLHTDLLVCDDIITLLMVAKYLERIGDHAVNISEWANYYEYGCKKIK